MRTLFTLILLGSLHAMRAQENSDRSITTNSAETANRSHKVERPLVLSWEPKLHPAYERAVIEAIQNRWDVLLDKINYDGSSTGKVVLKFRLHQNGIVTELKSAENTASAALALLSQSAVLKAAPFPKWSTEMRKQIGADSCTVRFTFLYDGAPRKKSKAGA